MSGKLSAKKQQGTTMTEEQWKQKETKRPDDEAKLHNQYYTDVE
jgi:hypothetical protein